MLNDWRVVFLLQILVIPARHKFDGVRRTCAAAGLAERAVERPCGEILFDGVERTEFRTFAAADAGGFYLPIVNPEDIEQGEQRPAWADVAAPESLAENP